MYVSFIYKKIYFLYLYLLFLLFFNLLCNSAFEQGHPEPLRYRNAFIIIILHVTLIMARTRLTAFLSVRTHLYENVYYNSFLNNPSLSLPFSASLMDIQYAMYVNRSH